MTYSSSETDSGWSGNEKTGGLQPGFTPLGIWAFSIGTSIGWGSFIVTCNTYLQKSGLLGTVFGLLLGMAVILVIAWNLQYMIRSAPGAGGIYTFQRQAAGRDMGFLALWFVSITYLAILWANITSLPLFARFFLGDIFRFGFHYQIFGYEVWMGEALLSICVLVLIGLLCSIGPRIQNRIMILAALVFTIGFAICALISMLRHESGFSFEPRYAEGSPAFAQIVRIAVISPWAFIGFENIAHFSEEYTFPVRRIRRILLASVLITTALYLFVSLLSVSAYPPEYESWQAYLQDMGSLEGIKAVPAFYAADYYMGKAGVAVLMLALFGVILTSLIGNMLALSRLLYAAGREADAPGYLTALNRHAVPGKAILTVVGISIFIPFLGRTAIGWIVDITTLGATLMYGFISYSVYRHAKQSRHNLEERTGIAGLVLMCCFLLLLLVPGLLPFHAMETESYLLFIVWSLAGLFYYRMLLRRDSGRDPGQRIVVWIILLVLMMFASMMWVSRETETAAEDAVIRIHEYHDLHSEDATDAAASKQRQEYLEEQARQISRTNSLYTIVSLGIFLLFISIMLNNYRDTRRLGARLTEAEKEILEGRKIRELKDTISSLLDNMPGMNFTKDAETGIYLACNQAFAEYAHKKNPDGVTGLTDAQIFDPETAAHFVEDDQMALSMEEPYIFFEDVPDAAGNQRQFQTTKLKYYDPSGKLCLLGMCQDVTDLVRIQRENATTREAYEKARSTGIIYSHIAQSLARGYTNLLYVNHETEEFIEYRIGDEASELTEARRGGHFFEACKNDINRFIYPEDREMVLKALDRRTLLQALDRSNTFVMTYRMLSEQDPVYVSMRIRRMEDDERFLVIGVTDVNEQMKERRAAERIQEERIAYSRINALTGDLLCAYVVIPETGYYREYSVTESFTALALPKQGEDFFGASRKEISRIIHPEDLDRFRSLFTREGVLSEIARSGIFALSYRLIIDGRSTFVRLKAAIVEEKEGSRLIVGIHNIDAHVRQEEEYEKRLAQAQSKANLDALTGVKNRHAYLDAEDQLDRQIRENRQPDFAIVIMDVNDLKSVNDREGHQAGDQYLRDACEIICSTFKRSPVYRVGGDEFAVIARGSDFMSIEELLGKMSDHNTEALQTGGIVIACGMSKYENDNCVAAVFERADLKMYENKNKLKSK